MRIAVIGLGGVGEACAHLLASRPFVRGLALANRTLEVARAVCMDLEQSRAWTAPLSAVPVAPWHDDAYRGRDVILLTVGERLRGGQTRAAKAEGTATALEGKKGESIVDALRAHQEQESGQSRSILLVVTNPVEATVTWLAERTGWAPERLIGLGTTVESARFSGFLADKADVDASSVWTEIVGEHGQNIEIRDQRALEQRLAELGRPSIRLDDLLQRTRDAAREIRAHSEAVGARRAEKVVTKLAGRVSDEVAEEDSAPA